MEDKCALLSGVVSLRSPEITNILFSNELILQAISGDVTFPVNFDDYIAPGLSKLEVGCVKILIRHPLFNQILHNRTCAFNFFHYAQRLLLRVTPKMAEALIQHPLFNEIIELKKSSESSEHISLTTLGLTLSMVARVKDKKIVFKPGYEGLTRYFCQDGKGLVLVDLINSDRKMKAFVALARLQPKTLEAVLEIETLIGDVLNDDSIASRFSIIAANLDNWYRRSPAVIHELPLLTSMAYDYMVTLSILDLIKLRKAETITLLLNYLKRSWPNTQDIGAFQSTLYLFGVFCKNELIPEDKIDELLISLLNGNTHEYYYGWLKDEVVGVLRESFAENGIDVQQEDWHNILIRGAIGIKNPNGGHYAIVKGIDFDRVKNILEHLGTELENPSYFALSLCYAINLRYFSPRVISEIPKGFAHNHNFATEDVWNNAHAAFDEETSSFSVGGVCVCSVI
ncbi:MAG: hypothetical protein EPN88_05000 [Bacteroidetes bacterium]|nr:MAG: hypothetical protein EPN88_05000 [Bacteroidota bacterium]